MMKNPKSLLTVPTAVKGGKVFVLLLLTNLFWQNCFAGDSDFPPTYPNDILAVIIRDELNANPEIRTVPDDQIQSVIAAIRARFDSQDEFDRKLFALCQVEVSRETARSFYDANPEVFKEPQSVRASHILFLVLPNAAKFEVDRKMAAANKAAIRARENDDFARLARELSEEPEVEKSGGDLGFFSKERMVPEIAEAAFSLNIGSVSSPVRTQFGWHVVKVTDTAPARIVPFDEIATKLIAYLKFNEQKKAIVSFLSDFRVESSAVSSGKPAPSASPAPGFYERNKQAVDGAAIGLGAYILKQLIDSWGAPSN